MQRQIHKKKTVNFSVLQIKIELELYKCIIKIFLKSSIKRHSKVLPFNLNPFPLQTSVNCSRYLFLKTQRTTKLSFRVRSLRHKFKFSFRAYLRHV